VWWPLRGVRRFAAAIVRIANLLLNKNRYDTDGNGWIDLSELECMITDVGKGIKRKRTSVFSMKSKAQVVSDATRAAVYDAQQLIKQQQVIKESKDERKKREKVVSNKEDAAKAAKKLAEDRKQKQKTISEEVVRSTKVANDVERGLWSAERVFAAFDSDKNGSLNVKELKLALTSLLGKHVSDEAVLAFTEKYDEDENGTLEFNEFEAIAKDAERDTKGFFASFNLGTNVVEDIKEVEKARADVETMEADDSVVV